MIEQMDAFNRLTSKTKAAVKLAGGPGYMSDHLPLSPSQISKCQSRHYSEMLRLDLVPIVEAVIESPVITEALAEMQGYRLVRTRAELADAPTYADVARVIKVQGAFASSYSAAMADLKIDVHERRELNELIEAQIATLREQQCKINAE